MKNCIGIIPARYNSSRLKGKPLIDICGKTMIQRVYEEAIKVLPHVYIATEDYRIFNHTYTFGGKAIITSAEHFSGTDRCIEALEKIVKNNSSSIDVVYNIQVDEPLITSEHLQVLLECFDDINTEWATLATPVMNPADLENKSEVFVVFDIHRNALYFSRSSIPHVFEIPNLDGWRI